MSDGDDARRRADCAVRAAEAGAAIAREAFRTDIEVELKDGKTDVVTRADREAQRRVVEVIAESFPGEPIVGEEDEELGAVPDEGPGWIVDPIDGTNNFVRGIPIFATSIAAVVDGEPVAAATVLPVLGETYRSGPDGATLNGSPVSVSDRSDPETCAVCPTIWWDYDRRGEYARAARAIVERFADMRRFGCAQAALAMVATGALDGVVTNVRANPWDSVAGAHAIREAGGAVTDLEGERWRHDSRGIVASNGVVHDEVLAAAREIDGDGRD